MTSLEESVVGIAADARAYHIKKWADDYIAKLEEHMRGWFISDIWDHDERCDADIQRAIDEMLRFLKGEGAE